jgi:hypothetical protein
VVKNWSIGFPFGYFEYRRNLPNLTYGGVSDFYLIPFVSNFLLIGACATIVNRAVVRYFGFHRDLAFWALSIVLLLAGYAIPPSTRYALESLLVVNSVAAVGLASAAALVAGVCFFTLVFICRRASPSAGADEK